MSDTSTDDEREALIKVIDQAADAPLSPEFVRTRLTVWIADAILAAGFRRSEGEPSDAEVTAAAQVMFEPDGPGGEYTWAEMVVEDPSRADIWREDARKVLRAARGAR